MADTLVSEIIVQAFREGNFIAVGESTTAEELAEAVPKLRNLISTVMGIELGEQLRDWYVPQAYNAAVPLRDPLTPDGTAALSTVPYDYPIANSRLVVKLTASRTLYMPSMPQDGARMSFVNAGISPTTVNVTLSGNGRFIEGAASIVTDLDAGTPVDFHGRIWFYRADLGNWVRIDAPLQSNSTIPTPPEFDDLWVTGLAIRLAPRFQVAIQQTIVARYEDMLGRLKKRYKQSERMPTSVEMRQMFRETPLSS